MNEEYIYEGLSISIGDRVICHGKIDGHLDTDGKDGVVIRVQGVSPGDCIPAWDIAISFSDGQRWWASGRDVWLEFPDKCTYDPLDEIEI